MNSIFITWFHPSFPFISIFNVFFLTNPFQVPNPRYFPQSPGYAILALVNQVISRIDFWDLGKLAKDRVKQFQMPEKCHPAEHIDTYIDNYIYINDNIKCIYTCSYMFGWLIVDIRYLYLRWGTTVRQQIEDMKMSSVYYKSTCRRISYSWCISLQHWPHPKSGQVTFQFIPYVYFNLTGYNATTQMWLKYTCKIL